MNTRWIWALVALGLGGCTASGEGPSASTLGHNFADDWTGARGFDRATLALERGDGKRVNEVGRIINRRVEAGSRGALSVSSAWMNARAAQAGGLEAMASDTPDFSERNLTRTDANRQYRAALAFLPQNARARRQLDPNTLNSLGYFLAERGRNKAEFQQAVELTQLAVELSPATNSTERLLRATGPQDSHAWALFKLGKTDQALQTQTQVLSTAAEETAKYGPPPAEVVYHFGAILRVAGHEEQARAAFKIAQKLNPSVELDEILEADLEGRVI